MAKLRGTFQGRDASFFEEEDPMAGNARAPHTPRPAPRLSEREEAESLARWTQANARRHSHRHRVTQSEVLAGGLYAAAFVALLAYERLGGDPGLPGDLPDTGADRAGTGGSGSAWALRAGADAASLNGGWPLGYGLTSWLAGGDAAGEGSGSGSFGVPGPWRPAFAAAVNPTDVLWMAEVQHEPGAAGVQSVASFGGIAPAGAEHSAMRGLEAGEGLSAIGLPDDIAIAVAEPTQTQAGTEQATQQAATPPVADAPPPPTAMAPVDGPAAADPDVATDDARPRQVAAAPTTPPPSAEAEPRASAPDAWSWGSAFDSAWAEEPAPRDRATEHEATQERGARERDQQPAAEPGGHDAIADAAHTRPAEPPASDNSPSDPLGGLLTELLENPVDATPPSDLPGRRGNASREDGPAPGKPVGSKAGGKEENRTEFGRDVADADDAKPDVVAELTPPGTSGKGGAPSGADGRAQVDPPKPLPTKPLPDADTKAGAEAKAGTEADETTKTPSAEAVADASTGLPNRGSDEAKGKNDQPDDDAPASGPNGPGLGLGLAGDVPGLGPGGGVGSGPGRGENASDEGGRGDGRGPELAEAAPTPPRGAGGRPAEEAGSADEASSTPPQAKGKPGTDDEPKRPGSETAEATEQRQDPPTADNTTADNTQVAEADEGIGAAEQQDAPVLAQPDIELSPGGKAKGEEWTPLPELAAAAPVAVPDADDAALSAGSWIVDQLVEDLALSRYEPSADTVLI